MLTGCSTGFGTFAYNQTADGKVFIVSSSNPKYDYETRITDIKGYYYDHALRWERDRMVDSWSGGQCKVVDERRENIYDLGSTLMYGTLSKGYVQHRYISGVVCSDTFPKDTTVLIIN